MCGDRAAEALWTIRTVPAQAVVSLAWLLGGFLSFLGALDVLPRWLEWLSILIVPLPVASLTGCTADIIAHVLSFFDIWFMFGNSTLFTISLMVRSCCVSWFLF